MSRRTAGRRWWVPAGFAFAVVVAALVALAMRQPVEGPAPPGSAVVVSPSATATADAPAPGAVTRCATTGARVVSTSSQLRAALARADAGTTIRLQDGVYAGSFTATGSGTRARPIVLCGSRRAVLDGGPIDGAYVLHLVRATYWQVSGFSLRGGQKGLVLDGSSGNLIEGLSVSGTGDEAIHLRSASSQNVVRDNVVRTTGLRRAKYGEGIYVGSAKSNWCDYSQCKPDRSDGNVVQGNDIAGTSAEAVDVKEGTTGGTVRDNVFDGRSITAADSWVDVKGNAWTVEGNRGTNAPKDAFQVHEILTGWGQRNVFAANVVESKLPSSTGVALRITGDGPGNVVRCDNRANGLRLSNVSCS